MFFFFFFFNDTATTEIYTLSLHDALPISRRDPGSRGAGLELRRTVRGRGGARRAGATADAGGRDGAVRELGDRKSTRLNSSHGYISYAVFCLKKKKKKKRRKRDQKVE